MNRRDLFRAAGALALLPADQAAAQTRGQVPVFPPIDERSVWLVGEGAPVDPAAFARRLAQLVEGQDAVQDSYLAEGAVGALEQTFAAMLGKEDCAFLPTGTLANQLAIRVLCGETQRAVIQRDSHIYRDESDSLQILSGIHLEAMAADIAAPTLSELAASVEGPMAGPFPVRTGAISIEAPVRRLGGRMASLQEVQSIAAYARDKGVGLHMDGARLLLAQPELDLKAYAACFDTVYISLYKYLDAPFGAVLAGSREHIAKVRELRHIYGGLIYNGWVAALPAKASLETFPDRMARSHGAARLLFERLEASGEVKRAASPDASNIFQLEMSEAFAAAAFERCRAEGIRMGMWRDGKVPFFVNPTILRRPIEEYAELLLG